MISRREAAKLPKSPEDNYDALAKKGGRITVAGFAKSQSARAAAAALTAGEPGAKRFWLEWTNHDDASFEGLFAFDPKKGAVRAVVVYNEP